MSTGRMKTPLAARQTAASHAQWADVGVHALSCLLVGVNAVGLIAVAVASAVVGPPIAWDSAVTPLAMLGVVGFTWSAHARVPGRRHEWVVAETLLAIGCVVLASLWLSPAQYLVAGGSRPLVDAQLAAADRWLGVDVSAWAAWTAARPTLAKVLSAAYFTLIAQFALAQLVAGLFLRDRRAVWEFAWHYTLGGFLTLIAWALWPAASAFQHYAFTSTIDQSRFIAHFAALRSGTFGVIDLADVEGLISMPSFHVLGALMVTWSMRTHRVTLAIALVVNALLIAATVLSGAHYLVDVIAAFVVFAASVVAWRLVGARLMPSEHVPGRREAASSA